MDELMMAIVPRANPMFCHAANRLDSRMTLCGMFGGDATEDQQDNAVATVGICENCGRPICPVCWWLE
jgi:hypothetical protein